MTILTKFSLGDTVYFMHSNQVSTGKVVKLSLELAAEGEFKEQEVYVLERSYGVPVSMHVSLLFPSKQALLESL